MLTEFTTWLLALIAKLFIAVWTFVSDAFIAFFKLVVDGFVALVTAIPMPAFITSGLAEPWGGLDSGVLYVVSQCGLPAALALIGAGYAFRLLRKFVTLFQW